MTRTPDGVANSANASTSSPPLRETARPAAATDYRCGLPDAMRVLAAGAIAAAAATGWLLAAAARAL